MTEARPSENPLAGWGTVFILVLAYAVSFVDRQVVGLLVEPIRADLHIKDTQIGLLLGPAFGLFYVLMGLPLGWLADRVHRVRLIAFGILVWSLMTIACGLADSFGVLFAARVGVGFGEAALVPAAVSLLADLFKPKTRALAMSAFTAGVGLGAGAAFVLGGLFIHYAAHGANDLPLIGPWFATRHNWQTVFILAGLLGLPIAAAVAMLREPERRGKADGGDHPSVFAAVNYLLAHWKLFAPMLGGIALLYLTSNAYAAWAPSLFIRGFGQARSQVGVMLGLMVMPCAVTGSLLSGALATWLGRGGRLDAPLRAMMLGALLVTPVVILAPLSPTAPLMLAGIGAEYFTIALCFGVATAAFVAATPERLRGQLIAIYLLVGNLVGLGLGSTTVGLLLDYVLRDPLKVGVALAIVGAATGGPGLLLLRSVQKGYARRVEELAGG